MASPLGILRQATQAVLGTPALFTAARGAGASTAAATDVLAASAAALRLAAARSDGTPGRQNAMRHFVWQAYLAGRHGTAVAQAVAATQERGRNAPVDSRIDAANNAIGQRYGVEHADLVGQGSRAEALDRLADVAAGLWSAGELASVRRP